MTAPTAEAMALTVRTEAGKRLLKWEREGNVPWDVALEAILSIEQEAAPGSNAAEGVAGVTLDVVKAAPDGLREALEWAAKDAHAGWLLWESDHPRGYGVPHAKEFSDCTVPACAGRLELVAAALAAALSPTSEAAPDVEDEALEAELAEAQEWCRQRSYDVPLFALAHARSALAAVPRSLDAAWAECREAAEAKGWTLVHLQGYTPNRWDAAAAGPQPETLGPCDCCGQARHAGKREYLFAQAVDEAAALDALTAKLREPR